jgi:large subunit ribosomal protein L18
MLEKTLKRLRRKDRVKASISASSRPRLSVFRSNSYIYAQIIDEST